MYEGIPSLKRSTSFKTLIKGLFSCSLACSKAHKSNCTPQHAPTAVDKAENQTRATTIQSARNDESTSRSLSTAQQGQYPSLEKLESSPQLSNLLTQFSNLRSRLREIYKLTLEEEWVETSKPNYGRGGRQSQGRDPHNSRGATRNRGPWTAEKGFNRGLGKVRHWRDSCEEGACGVDDEGFMQFISLVLRQGGSDEQTRLNGDT